MAIGREDYAERKENRIERLEHRASKATEESMTAYKRASEIGRLRPFGQPILVGHHSEKQARNDQRRIERNMDKCLDAGKKAEYYAGLAQAAANNKAISSDDPEAIEKLKAKLSKLQAAQKQDKALNAYYRKYKTVRGFEGINDDEAEKADAQLAEMREEIRRPVPAWCLSNRNAEINRLKKRIAGLCQVDEMEHIEIRFDGGQIVTNEQINRVQIYFDSKPDETVRKELKNWGFRWSPGEGAWQALRTPAYLRRAERLCHVDEV